jgi:cob(I)alamin adenosyltransferase
MTKKKGLVIVNTGKGKGKTTAALGLLFRAWGRGMNVCMLQFIKSENAKYGEIKAARKLNIEIIPTGDGFTWLSKDMDETTARARHGWELAQQKIASSEYDVIVLDEFTCPLHFGWLDVDEVIAWLKENKPPMLHLVITGRNAPEKLIEFADLVTEMQEVKHPYQEGIKGQPGVEF